MDKNLHSAFGAAFDVTPREDFQLAKVQITFRGWLFDPRFGYNAYVWTRRPARAGRPGRGRRQHQLDLQRGLRVYFGIHSLPSTARRTGLPLLAAQRPTGTSPTSSSADPTPRHLGRGHDRDGLQYPVMVANNPERARRAGPVARREDSTPTRARSPGCRPRASSDRRNRLATIEDTRSLATLFSAHYTRSTEHDTVPAGHGLHRERPAAVSDGTLLFSSTALQPARTDPSKHATS
jgi:hypothetical protein